MRKEPVTWITIAASNYLDRVRVLARSLSEHMGGARLQLILIDDNGGENSGREEPFDRVSIEDLGSNLPARNTDEDRQQYAVQLKPHALRYALTRSENAAIFLDPDVMLMSSLSDVVEQVERSPITLSPHLLTPPADDSRHDRELEMLRTGIFNGGFVGVSHSSETEQFLSWWEEKLNNCCHHDVARGVYYDQRWLDFAPSFFPIHILRDPAVNVAYWNLAERDFHEREGRFFVGGKPVSLFHFSGFDREAAHRLSRYVSANSTPSDAARAVADLYETRLEEVG